MIINIRQNSFGIQDDGTSEPRNQLKLDQKRASEDFLIQTLMSWWTRNVSNIPLANTNDRWSLKSQIKGKLEEIEAKGDLILERTIDGWDYI